MENVKKATLSDGNFMVYLWFWGGLIVSFITGWFDDLLKFFFPNENNVGYMAIMLIFNLVILYLMVKYVVVWLRNRYEFGNTKKLLKITFEIFVVWSTVGMGLAYWGLSPLERADPSSLIFFILEYLIELLVFYISLNKYLRIRYYK